MSGIRYTATRYDAGTVYGAWCRVCDAVVFYGWVKREARQSGKEHAREHRRSGQR